MILDHPLYNWTDFNIPLYYTQYTQPALTLNKTYHILSFIDLLLFWAIRFVGKKGLAILMQPTFIFPVWLMLKWFIKFKLLLNSINIFFKCRFFIKIKKRLGRVSRLQFDDGGRNSNTKFSVLFAHLGVMCVQNLKRCQLLQNLQIWLSFYAWSSSLQFVHATFFFL